MAISLEAWLSLGMIVGVWTIAVVVFAARPEGVQNRRLGFYLLTAGVAWSANQGIQLLVSGSRVAYASGVLVVVMLMVWPLAYAAFLSTLGSALARPLRSKPFWWLAGTASLAIGILVLWMPHWFVTVVDVPGFGASWFPVEGPSWRLMLTPGLIAGFYGIAVAVDMIRIAHAPLDRRRAWAYLVAFGLLDLNIVAIIAPQVLTLIVGTNAAAFDFAAFWTVYVAPFVVVAACLALAYGILSAHLFDIDLKIKWTISRATVATAFLGVFFVVGLAASEFLVDRFGYLYGAVAAGLLLFAMRPLQKLGQSVADAAMPRVADTPGYRLVRSREVYRAAYDSALQDGEITSRERDMLATLQEQLEIKPTEARAIEKGVV